MELHYRELDKDTFQAGRTPYHATLLFSSDHHCLRAIFAPGDAFTRTGDP
jgi:hypothetical protein